MTFTDTKDLPVMRLMTDLVEKHYHPCGSINSSAQMIGDLRALVAEAHNAAVDEVIEGIREKATDVSRHEINRLGMNQAIKIAEGVKHE